MTAAAIALLVSLTSSAFLVWLVYFLGYRGGRRFASEAEFLALSAPYGGAQAHLLDLGGASGVALLGDGQLLVAKIVGNHVATRVFKPSSVASLVADRAGQGAPLAIEMRFKDFGFAALKLTTTDDNLPDWLDHLHVRKAA